VPGRLRGQAASSASGHYTVDGATDMVWWRQTHIVLDILCGIAILAFAVRLARRRAD
jgi:hypothetical protein